MTKEIVNLEPLCRFQRNAKPTKLRRNYTCGNFTSIACNLNKIYGIFEEEKKKNNMKDKANAI